MDHRQLIHQLCIEDGKDAQCASFPSSSYSGYSLESFSCLAVVSVGLGGQNKNKIILKFTMGLVYLSYSSTSDIASEVIIFIIIIMIIVILLPKITLFCAPPKTTLLRTIQRTTLFESLSNSLHNSFYKLSSRKKSIETDMECSFLCPLIHSCLC